MQRPPAAGMRAVLPPLRPAPLVSRVVRKDSHQGGFRHARKNSPFGAWVPPPSGGSPNKAPEKAQRPITGPPAAAAAAATQMVHASAAAPPGNGGDVAPCKCKRNRCLKRYCPCFALGRFCGEACTCSNCRNRSEHKDLVLKNIARVHKRNKNGFGPRTVLLHAAGAEGSPPRMAHKKGCRCPRSRCLKKYCECYEAGVMCSTKCKCVGCANPFGARPEAGGGQGAPKS